MIACNSAAISCAGSAATTYRRPPERSTARKGSRTSLSTRRPSQCLRHSPIEGTTLRRHALWDRRWRGCAYTAVSAMAGGGGTSCDGRAILVTGGNDGIGLALCRQLAKDYGCRVFLGSRNAERGQAALKKIALPEGCGGSVGLVQVDVSEDGSVKSAAEAVAGLLGETKLYAIVNNAGIIGVSSGASGQDVVNTNLFGTKRVCEAFLPLLCPTEGRIVNVGSGSGPMYVRRCPPQAQAFLCSPPESWEQIEAWVKGEWGLGSSADGDGGYGLSKALITCYTMLLAKKYPQITSSCISPGFIDTKMTSGWGAPKSPDEGTVSIRHALFADLEGNGWYYGSDGVRSPLHFMRNPGEPAYDGSPP